MGSMPAIQKVNELQPGDFLPNDIYTIDKKNTFTIVTLDTNT